MNCKRAEELLALYVRDDLPVAETRRVSLHLDLCLKCQTRAKEFHASVALSRSSFVPEFNQNLLAGIRSEVLGRIAPKPQTRFAKFLEKRFALRRIGYAYILALMFVSGLFASYIRFSQSRRPHIIRNSNVYTAEMRAGEARLNTPDSNSPHNLRSPVAPKRVEGRNTSAQVSRRLRSTRVSTARRNVNFASSQTTETGSLPAEDLIATSRTNEVAVDEAVASTNGTKSGDAESGTNNAASVESAVAGAEAFRIEIQTSDPNLRIIWLSPKTQNAPPVKSGAHGS